MSLVEPNALQWEIANVLVEYINYKHLPLMQRVAFDMSAVCSRIIKLPEVEGFIIVLILANCATLAMYNPTDPTSSFNRNLGMADLVFNGLFTVEMLLKIGAAGGIQGYASNPWNTFDGMLVLLGYT